MQFGLRSIFLAFVVVGSAMGAFGPWGLAVGLVLVAGAAASRMPRARPLRLLVMLPFAALLLPPVILSTLDEPRENTRRANCLCWLGGIQLALHVYHDSFGRLPPAYVLGPDGKPWHSWRVLILPYLEEQDLYDQYNFNEPWNGPNNSKLAASIPTVYVCPSLGGPPGTQTTSYVAVVGQQTMWPGAKGRRFREVKDGRQSTILVVEAPGAGIQWLEPRDLTFDELVGPEGRDPKANPLGAHVLDPGWPLVRDGGGATSAAMADGRICFIPQNMPSEQLAGLLTVDGGESVDIGNLARPPGQTRIHWPRLLSLVVLLASTALLYRSIRPRPKGTGPADGAPGPLAS